jgi:hypothetical protein
MQSKEKEILMVMRKVLTSIIKDVTPVPGRPSPLSEQTTEGVRDCLKLIALRERELADADGDSMKRPYYKDQGSAPKVVPISDIARPSSENSDDD